jgi:hypothetical protein
LTQEKSVVSSDPTNSKIGFSNDLSVWDKLSHSVAYGLKVVVNLIICFKGGSRRKAGAAWHNIFAGLAPWLLYRLSLLSSFRYFTPPKACSDQDWVPKSKDE